MGKGLLADDTGGWTVFLVDDDPDDLFMAERAFKDSPYVDNVVCVDGGADFLDQILNHDFFSETVVGMHKYLIVLDIHMPGLDGVELLTSLKDCYYIKNIPVFMLTSDVRTELIAKTYDMNADGYLLKPLNENGLSHIHKVLEKRCAS